MSFTRDSIPKRRLHVGLLLALLLCLLLLSTTATHAQLGETYWEATYWNNRDMSGEPVLIRPELELNYDWGGGSPDELINDDDFSVRWQRNFSFVSGTYRFTATMDDGMRVRVDGTTIIDSWTDSAVHTVNGEIYLTAGEHQVTVDYYEAGGMAAAALDWTLTTGDANDNWLARYFNNAALIGQPAFSRYETNINLSTTGAPAPGIAADNFSVIWSQNVLFDRGVYRFVVTGDDGVRLWVNGQLVIDEWRDQSATTYIAEMELPTGLIPIEMRYYERAGNAEAMLSWTQIGATPPPGSVINNWRGEYYNDSAMNGAPVLIRDDAEINFNWGLEGPAPVNPDRFSVRWTQTVNLTPGRYTFTTTTDDGVRLWVNNELLIDEWHVQVATSYSADVEITGGAVPIVMEYFENTGLAQARLIWTPNLSPGSPTDEPLATMRGATYLNVRSGPGLEFESFDVLRNGQTVPMVGRDTLAIWIEVRLPDGTTGWVSSRYLVSNTPFNNLPITG